MLLKTKIMVLDGTERIKRTGWLFLLSVLGQYPATVIFVINVVEQIQGFVDAVSFDDDLCQA
ncbi:MAG: hypothetical protein BBJ57_10035 [Desulfobacterales bacterium PC51MH44]|nr:MAG: hypothetical protein BBJ57_10035 [Desulfobacterales bacterium PC51MH44]